MTELFDLHPDILNAQGSVTLLVRLMLNLIFTGTVVFGVYARRYGKNQYLFTYMMFNLITFTLCFLLRQVPIELGFALGLFAVFGILRYRTEPIQINDLTYLFVVIGIGILNAVVNNKISLSQVLIVNGSIIGLTALLEQSAWFRTDTTLRILYDDFEILKKNDERILIEDLHQRTGLNINKVKVERLDLLRETAELIIFYEAQK